MSTSLNFALLSGDFSRRCDFPNRLRSYNYWLFHTCFTFIPNMSVSYLRFVILDIPLTLIRTKIFK